MFGNHFTIEPLELRRLYAAAGSWTDLDIGPVGRTGSASNGNDGSITMAGSGIDISKASDSFNFDYQPFSGDGTLVAQVAAHSNAVGSKAGIMLRETTNAASRFAMVALMPGRVVMQARTATHRTLSFSIAVSATAGDWIELQRTGITFTGLVSTDETNWRTLGTVQTTMVDNIDAGLCLTSHHNRRLATAVFRSVTISPTSGNSSLWIDGQTEPLNRWEAETFTWNDKLYAFGGLTANDKSDRAGMWSLDLSNPSDTWTNMEAMPDARNHFGTAVINGIIYAVGGMHRYDEIHGNDAEVDAYNPSTNQWTKMASLPMPWGSNETTTIVAESKILLVGGQTNGGFDGIYLNTIEEYDPSSNTWISAASLPEANEGESAAYVKGELVVAGGTVDNRGGWAQDQTWRDTFTP